MYFLSESISSLVGENLASERTSSSVSTFSSSESTASAIAGIGCLMRASRMPIVCARLRSTM